MRILLIRHGVAEEAETGSGSKAQEDALRELTKEGRRNMRKAAKGLNRILPSLNLIASSPLVRACQTADIIASEFGAVRVVQIAALSPRKPPAQLLDWINAHSPESTVALVGHEPHLSTFLCWILTGLQESFISLKKGGAALIKTSTPVAAGRGKLLWVMKPSQLRKIR